MHSSLKTLSLYFGGAIAFNTSGENGIVDLVFLLCFLPLGSAFLAGVCESLLEFFFGVLI